MKKSAAIVGFAVAVSFLGAGAFAQDRAEALRQWEKIYEVFSHPRCANCHVEDTSPRWSGPHYGITRIHGFAIGRGVDGFGNPGQRCTTCHFETNAEKQHGPPGAPHWHLAPAEMAWFGKSSAEICAQISDPERNGDRSLLEIAEHVRDDALVGWGWSPGPGRQPAPGTPEALYEAIVVWSEAGGQCPGKQDQ